MSSTPASHFEDGSLKCWGENEDGRLGYGDTVDRGFGPMGINLPFVMLVAFR